MTNNPHVLFAASECREFFKSGGLADVVSALPNALINEGIRVSTILPYYTNMEEALKITKQPRIFPLMKVQEITHYPGK